MVNSNFVKLSLSALASLSIHLAVFFLVSPVFYFDYSSCMRRSFVGSLDSPGYFLDCNIYDKYSQFLAKQKANTFGCRKQSYLPRLTNELYYQDKFFLEYSKPGNNNKVIKFDLENKTGLTFPIEGLPNKGEVVLFFSGYGEIVYLKSSCFFRDVYERFYLDDRLRKSLDFVFPNRGWKTLKIMLN